jgi:hypothetical protein
MVHEVSRSPRQESDTAIQVFTKPRFGHNFADVRVYANPSNAGVLHLTDGATDEEESVDQLPSEEVGREGEVSPGVSGGLAQSPTPSTELQTPPGGTPPPAACPTGIQVETLTDLTPQGLAAGYLTAYGAVVKMRVLPDTTNWNGTHIDEALTVNTSGTCPGGLTPHPCSAGPGFTVGAPSGASAILPAQPAQRNRFYDFHTTKWRSASLLHDTTRNPGGMNSCTMICNQAYSCGGAVIGRFTITRKLTKDTFNGTDVTRVSVSKT